MLPILFQLGPLTIYSYGFFLTLSYIIATFILWREGKRQGYQEEKLLDLSLISLIAALIGGRLYYSIFHFNLFRDDLLSALVFWEGGLSFYGALFGVLLVGILIARAWKWPFFQIADIAALAGLAAFAIGKVGAFLAGVDFGTPTSLPWAVEFTNLLGARHPVQLYEAGAAAALFFMFKKFYEGNLKSKDIKSGKNFLLAVFLFALSRLFFEFFRADSTYIAGIKSAQIVSFIVAIFAFTALYYFRYRDLQKDLENFLKFILSINSRVLRKLGI